MMIQWKKKKIHSFNFSLCSFYIDDGVGSKVLNVRAKALKGLVELVHGNLESGMSSKFPIFTLFGCSIRSYQLLNFELLFFFFWQLSHSFKHHGMTKVAPVRFLLLQYSILVMWYMPIINNNHNSN